MVHLTSLRTATSLTRGNKGFPPSDVSCRQGAPNGIFPPDRAGEQLCYWNNNCNLKSLFSFSFCFPLSGGRDKQCQQLSRCPNIHHRIPSIAHCQAPSEVQHHLPLTQHFEPAPLCDAKKAGNFLPSQRSSPFLPSSVLLQMFYCCPSIEGTLAPMFSSCINQKKFEPR